MEKIIKELRNYILGLIEFDLTTDISYLKDYLVEYDIISSDQNIEYKWEDEEKQQLCINIVNKNNIDSYQIKIDITKKIK